MIISDFYQTKIESFSYEEYATDGSFVPCYTLDTSSITKNEKELIIKVSLIDFNNEPVTNKEVVLNVNAGFFSAKDVVANTSYSLSNDNKTLTGTTSEYGVIYAHYKINMGERGISVFSANATVIQVDNLNPYPVGSVYMSFTNTNPSNLFGGEWTPLPDRFLLGAGSKNVEATGGSETHTLTKEQIPSHNHSQTAHNHSAGSGRSYLTAPTGSGWREIQGANIGGSGYHYIATSDKKNYNVYLSNGASAAPGIGNTGGGQAHNNMPPYIVVYMWRRVK